MDGSNGNFSYGESIYTPSADGAAAGNGKDKRKRPTAVINIVLIIAAVLLSAVVFAIVNQNYTISNIVINGSAPYQQETLRQLADEYCDGKNGRSFFYVDEKELEEKYYSAFPYLKSVSVSKKHPNTLVVTVEREEPQAYFHMMDAYYIINENMKVLERLEERPVIPALIEISISVPNEIKVGSQLVFGEGVVADVEVFSKLYSAIVDNSLRYDVVSIKAENKFELSMTLRSGTDVKIGSIKDVEDKISGLKKWMDENLSMLGPRVNIDITIIKKITVTYD